MKQLMDLAPAEPACLKADPRTFDYPECFPDALAYCEECPVQGWCLDTVDPAANHYDGVVGGLAWLNGRVIFKPAYMTDAQKAYEARYGDLSEGTNQRIKPQNPDEYDWVMIHNFIEGLVHWRKLTRHERVQAAMVMAQQGKSTSDIQEATHLNGTIIKSVFDTLEGNPK